MAEPQSSKLWQLKLLVLSLVIVAYFYCPGLQSFVTTSATYLKNGDFNHLRQFILSFGLWAPATSIAIMALQSLVPFVPGLIITITNAWIFGWQYGAFYSWLGALLGAILDFGIARWYGRPFAKRLISPKYLKITDSFFMKHGIIAVFITRLTPIVPFKVVSYGAGLTAISPFQFILATAIGQTPAILLYSILGQHLSKNSQIILAITSLIIVVGILAFYFRAAIERRLS